MSNKITYRVGRRSFTGSNVTDQINEWLKIECVQVINIETIESAAGGHMSDVSLKEKATIVWFQPLALV